MRSIDAEATRAVLPFSRPIPALRERFISGCEVPLRHVRQVLPEAHRTVRAIGQVTVWASQPAAADTRALAWRAQGFHPTAAPDQAAAVAGADIVSCDTLATAPVVLGRWLRPGSHLDLIGGFTPAMRETDDD